jgi:Uma2 family endonuclease
MTQVLTRPSPVGIPSLDDIQHLVLEDVDWDLYEALLRNVGDRPLQLTYDQGRLEIMSPLPEHEDAKKFTGRMIEALSFELDLPVKCLGSTTFRRRDKEKGLEPDECYYFRDEAKMRGRKRLDLRKDPPPELVVEIDVTSRSVPREPIYAALGVPEIWRYDGRKLQCLHLAGKKYRIARRSLVFTFLQPAQLTQFIDQLPFKDENSILREFLKWAQDRKQNK